MSASTIRIYIDKKWTSCSLTEEFGALGVRYQCVLGKSPGQPNKRLLIRYNTWPQHGGALGEKLLALTVGRVTAGKWFTLRPVTGKRYHVNPSVEGDSRNAAPCHVFQQDINDLTPLGSFVQRVFAGDRPQLVWKVFHACCKALREFGEVIGSDVPLQSPTSLALDTNVRIVLLDAEVRLADALPTAGEARQLYEHWFGPGYSDTTAPVIRASVLHAEALMRFFRELFQSLRPRLAGGAANICDDFLTRSGNTPPGRSLGALEEWIAAQAEDWNIYVEDEESRTGVISALPVATVAVSPTAGLVAGVARGGNAEKRRSLLLRLSLWLNLLLALVIILLVLLWPRRRGVAGEKEERPRSTGVAGEKEESHGSSPLVFSSYSVITPVQGTIGEKVGAALEELFPGKSFAVSPDRTEHSKRLREKLTEAIKSLGDSTRHRQLLARLATDHGVRFKGFSPEEPDDGLPSVIARGAVFTIAGDKQRHGSLLQSNGLDKILAHAGMKEDRAARDILESLKTATAEYASLKDALSVIRDQTAYILHVEPTAKAHEQARTKLLSRLERPVFISRPVLELYDAVDPSADTGGGLAAYSLTLDRPCFWRQASREARRDIDYKATASVARIKWQRFEAGHKIAWKPVPLTRKNGKTEAVSSFDIAVVLPTNIVVFRNQSLLVGETKQQVLKQGEIYITTTLGLRIAMGAVEDAVSVRKLGEQWTGTLIYSFLAEQVRMEHVGIDKDLQFFKPADFDRLRMEEDSF